MWNLQRPLLFVICFGLFSWHTLNSAVKYLERDSSLALSYSYDETATFPSISFCPIFSTKFAFESFRYGSI